MSDSNFGFILRVTNPCKYSSFTSRTSNTLNTLTPTTINTINTSVLLSTSEVFSEFIDLTSSTYTTADDYTLCGARTYSFTPAYSWLTLISSSPTVNTLTAYSTSNSDVAYTGVNGGCYAVTLSSYLTLYTAVLTTQSVTVCIEECEPTAFTLTTAVVDQTYTIFDPELTIATYGYTQAPLCGYSVVYTATIQKTATSTLVSDPVDAAASALTASSHAYLKFQDPSTSIDPSGHS
jgi:hypothetical protein